VKRKKSLPVVLAFEKASPKTRAELNALFAPPAPLPAENVERIRGVLEELGVRAPIEREIADHRDAALAALRGIAAMRNADARGALESLVRAATGAEAAATAGSASA
jgi:geranylgeranyl pyrophosphate synthase